MGAGGFSSKEKKEEGTSNQPFTLRMADSSDILLSEMRGARLWIRL